MGPHQRQIQAADDHPDRGPLPVLQEVPAHLEAASIAFRADLARTEFFSDPDEWLNWQTKSLHSDDLCTENAVMLKRFNRYPLIIDPRGQAAKICLATNQPATPETGDRGSGLGGLDSSYDLHEELFDFTWYVEASVDNAMDYMLSIEIK